MAESPADILDRAKAFIVEHGAYKYGKPIQDLMDLVSGVCGYRMDAATEQGFIYRKLLNNKFEHNHIIDIDVMISKFWYGAIQTVLRAKPVGAIVDIKNPTDNTPRKTKLPPLSYIRNMGVARARKYIDECCRARLKQLCHDCSRVSSLGRQRELDPGCKCGCKESTLPRVFGNKIRTCTECGRRRLAYFERVCGSLRIDEDSGKEYVESGCGSSNISIIQSEEFVDSSDKDAWEWKFGLTETDPESDVSNTQVTQDAARFAKACIDALPEDLSDPTGDSKTRKILRIMVDPQEGAGICKQCREQDSDSCGAQTFDISECVNYSKKLGRYFGYSTTLANRRVKKIRSHTIKFAREHANEFVTAKYIADSMDDITKPPVHQ